MARKVLQSAQEKQAYAAGLKDGQEAERARYAKAVGVCRLVQAIHDAMMLHDVHDDFTVREILEEYSVETVDLLAKKAEDLALEALRQLEKTP